MKSTSPKLRVTLSAVVVLAVIVAAAQAANAGRKYHTYRRPEIYVPISLGKGTINTPAFLAKEKKPHTYIMMLETERTLPLAEMMCMLGVKVGPMSSLNCGRPALLQGSWTLSEDATVLTRGSFHDNDEAVDSTNHCLFKHFGSFVAKPGKRYSVELVITSDASALDVTNPRFVLMLVKPTDW